MDNSENTPTEGSSPPLLELCQVTKSFEAVRALDGVSFDLRAGETHALLGENGAGKSTLIKIITGAHRPDSGRILMQGKPVAHLTPALARQLGIACIYQQPALFPDLTVAENIALRLRRPNPFQRVDWQEWKDRASQLLERIGAKIAPDMETRELSMPEQQLVEIASAVGAGARVVIMDEPTAALTQKEQHLLFAIARELRTKGIGVIYISHRLEEIFALADRVTILRDGRTVGTHRLEETNETALIRMMVGREISQVYPQIESKAGRETLSVKGLKSQALGLHEINFRIFAGEVLGLAGLVGSGRTELAQALFGINPPDAGEIILNGKLINARSPQEAIEAGIALLPEDRRRHGVVFEMPVSHNITMAILQKLFPSAFLQRKKEQAIALEHIRRLEIRAPGPGAPIKTLSGGNQQKVALARWLAGAPQLLILDEPTQGVDVAAKEEIHKIIRELAREGIAILMISSDLPEVIGMSDRILVMRQGTIAGEFAGRTAAHDLMAAALGQQTAA